MTKASDNVFPRFLISEGGSTATPAANRVTIYAKANGLLYAKDDAGTETAVSGAISAVQASAVTGDGSGDVTTTSATLVDLTGASITVTTGARKVKIGFTGTASCSTASGLISVGLSIDAADVGGTLGLTRGTDASASVFQNISFTYMTPSAQTAASHTFKVRWATSTGTGTMKNASATVVWHMWVEECPT